MRCARQTPHHPAPPHMPWQLPGPLLPHCATHLRHEFDVVSLVTFKIVFNYFLTSSSVKSVGRPSLPTPLPLPLPPSPRHWRLWGGSRPRAKGAIVAAWWAPALPTHPHTHTQLYRLYTAIYAIWIFANVSPQTVAGKLIYSLLSCCCCRCRLRCFHQFQISENRKASGNHHGKV